MIENNSADIQTSSLTQTKHKNIWMYVLVGVVIFFAGLGGGIWLTSILYIGDFENVETQVGEEIVMRKVENTVLEGFTQYKNEKMGIVFQYPTAWGIPRHYGSTISDIERIGFDRAEKHAGILAKSFSVVVFTDEGVARAQEAVQEASEAGQAPGVAPNYKHEELASALENGAGYDCTNEISSDCNVVKVGDYLAVRTVGVSGPNGSPNISYTFRNDEMWFQLTRTYHDSILVEDSSVDSRMSEKSKREIVDILKSDEEFLDVQKDKALFAQVISSIEFLEQNTGTSTTIMTRYQIQ